MKTILYLGNVIMRQTLSRSSSSHGTRARSRGTRIDRAKRTHIPFTSTYVYFQNPIFELRWHLLEPGFGNKKATTTASLLLMPLTTTTFICQSPVDRPGPDKLAQPGKLRPHCRHDRSASRAAQNAPVAGEHRAQYIHIIRHTWP